MTQRSSRRALTKVFIVVNKLGSKFAKALQRSLQTKVTQRVLRSRLAWAQQYNFFVNQRSLNKIEQLQRMKDEDVPCPPFTTDVERIAELGSKTVFARTLVNSTNGKGIVEFSASDVAPRAPLYSAYIPKKSEYRVHVFNGEVIDIQEKRKRNGFQGERNTRVRNLNNGYVYCRDDLNPPDGIGDLAIRAVQAVGYPYGAVDIIYNAKRDKCYVLEVNSKPGLQGTTLDKYADAIKKELKL